MLVLIFLSLEFTKNGAIKEKHTANSGSVGGIALVMREIRLDQANRKTEKHHRMHNTSNPEVDELTQQNITEELKVEI